MPTPLHTLFSPNSIALIGASDREGSLGKLAFESLRTSSFKGSIFAVNLRRPVLDGQAAFARMKDLPEPVDLAIVATPARTLESLIKDCGESGAKAMLVLSPVMLAKGKMDSKTISRLKKLASGYSMRILGADSIGFQNVRKQINASLLHSLPRTGNLAVISESGAVLTSLLDMGRQQKVGFSYIISTGAMIDLDLADLIDFLGTDSGTSCILIYLEHLKNPRRFMSAARAFSRSKPIVVLKAGRRIEYPAAHKGISGPLPGDDRAYDAAFRRSGIVRVNTLAQLFNCGVALQKPARPSNTRLAIITNAGGPAQLAADHLLKNGGKLATLQKETREQLKEELGASFNAKNPIDLFGIFEKGGFQQAASICLKDKQVDGILVIITPKSNSPLLEIAEALVELSQTTRKLILASWMGATQVEKARQILDKGGIPNYRFPESAIDVFLFLVQYYRRIQLLFETPPSVPEHFSPSWEKANQLIEQHLAQGRLRLNEHESKAILSCYEIPLVPSILVHTPAEARKAAQKTGFPVVVKLLSADLPHKFASGAVRLNLHSPNTVEVAAKEILNTVKKEEPEVGLEGLLVEPMVKSKLELLFRAYRDPVLGPVIAFGKGGVSADVYRDYTIEIPPLNMALANHLLEGTRIYPLLKGFRGEGGVDQKHLAVTLYKFAYLVMDFPEIEQISVNPFLADTEGGLGVDAQVILRKPRKAERQSPYAHLIISPYPSQYIRPAKMRNGQDITLRPIRPEDEPLEMEMVEQLSRDTLYFRFFGLIPKISHEWLSRFTHIDYDREMAIIAELKEKGKSKMIGVVRIIQDPAELSAEYAITIADPWQGQGLGGMLTDFILEIARDMGLKRIYASVMASNDRMLKLFRRRGFRVWREEFDTYMVELEL